MSENKLERHRLEGRVAQILNARELVINIGSTHGVTPKMKFSVLSETPLEVRDPVTREVLDVLDREKVRVIASDVREKISICRTYRVTVIPGGPLYGNPFNVLGDAFKPPKEILETLEAKGSAFPPPLSPEQSYVKINDRVIQVAEE